MTKTIIITGGSSGIGEEAARQLAKLGAKLIIVGRDKLRTEKVASDMGADFFTADFSKLSEVRELATSLNKKYQRIDVLVNNAGGMVPKRIETLDGHEFILQVNYLAPFLLTKLLLDNLREAKGKIINTASSANLVGHIDLSDVESKKWFISFQKYGTTKLMNILHARELAKRYGKDIFAASFFPGKVSTRFWNTSGIFSLLGHGGMTPISEAVKPLLWLSGEDSVGKAKNGGYYDKVGHEGMVNFLANDPKLSADLWELSEKLTS